jgi:ABC-2 type transport system permease protein
MRQLRSELLKLRTTRTSLILFGAMVVLVALVVSMHVLAPAAASLAGREQQMKVFEVGTIVGMLFGALFGANAIAAEFRYGTIRPTFLVTPRRWPVIAAKFVAAALVGIVVGLVAEGLMAGTAAAAFSARGITNLLTSADYERLFLGGAAAAALFAVIGVGVGSLIRNQAAALVTLFAWLFIVENILRGFVPGFGRFMPGSGGLSMTGQAGDRLLATTTGALLVLGYVVVVGAAGWLGTLRRDVA